MSSSSSLSVSVFQIPVKMGSHKLNIDIESNSTVNSSQFIELVLKKCKLTSDEKLARTYSLFESVSGIERLLKSSVNIASIWRQWVEQSAHHSVQLIVRKCFKVEKKLNSSLDCGDRRQQMIKKCYAKINAQPKSSTEAKAKREYLKKIIQNEKEIKKQSEQLLQIEAMLSNLNVVKSTEQEVKPLEQEVVPVPVKPTKPDSKLCSFHHNNLVSNLNEKLSDNINFLQFLYYKLKKQNIMQQNKSFSYEKLIDNSCGNSSSGEDNYDSNSNRTSRSTSSSTLESLV